MIYRRLAATQDRDSRRALAALSHPVRVWILDHLRAHETGSAQELAREFGVPLNTMSYHVRRLHELGYLRLVKRTQRRGVIARHYALAHPDDAEQSVRAAAGRLLVDPEAAHAKAHALLDATAIAKLRVELEALFARMRQLQEETTARIELDHGALAYSVDVFCVTEQDQGGRVS
jgi:DNA-binding transcriptional ArsR family regulator